MQKYFECLEGPYNLSDTERIGIIRAEDWFKGIQNTITQIYIRPEDLVVGKWSELSDGIANHAEGFITMAICKEWRDAKLIVLSRRYPYSFDLSNFDV